MAVAPRPDRPRALFAMAHRKSLEMMPAQMSAVSIPLAAQQIVTARSFARARCKVEVSPLGHANCYSILLEIEPRDAKRTWLRTL